MISTRLGAVRDPDAPFPLDRVIALVLRIAIPIYLVHTTGNLLWWWHHYQRSESKLTFLGYLQRGWWTHAEYVTLALFAFWLTFGLAQGRRWAFISLLLLAVGGLGRAIHYGSAFNIGLFSFEIVYAAMRLTGSLSERPSRKDDEGNATVALDHYAASVALFLTAVSIGLYVSSTLRGWHKAQDTGTIAYLPYLAQTWWSRIDYLGMTALEVWSTLTCFRSRRWAFTVLAILSLGWLFHPIHTGEAFYLGSNAYTLAYCTGRLMWARRRLRVSAGGHDA